MSYYDRIHPKQLMVKGSGQGITKMLGLEKFDTVGPFLGVDS